MASSSDPRELTTAVYDCGLHSGLSNERGGPGAAEELLGRPVGAAVASSPVPAEDTGLRDAAQELMGAAAVLLFVGSSDENLDKLKGAKDRVKAALAGAAPVSVGDDEPVDELDELQTAIARANSPILPAAAQRIVAHLHAAGCRIERSRDERG